jgi:hypothetical protein
MYLTHFGLIHYPFTGTSPFVKLYSYSSLRRRWPMVDEQAGRRA